MLMKSQFSVTCADQLICMASQKNYTAALASGSRS